MLREMLMHKVRPCPLSPSILRNPIRIPLLAIALYLIEHWTLTDMQYGRNFSLALQPSDPPPSTVPKRVLSKLSLFIPSKELVDAYLGEIAKGYGVAWLPEPSFGEDQDVQDQKPSDGEGGAGGGDDGGGLSTGDKKVGDKPEDSDKGTKEGQSGAEEESNASAAPANIPPPPAGPEKDAWAAPPGKKMTEEEELAKRFERLKQLK
jgi:vacuolar protein sorting-associated protein IST1